REQSITNCPAAIALKPCRFDPPICELFLAILRDSSALWQLLCVICLQSHMTDAPCVQRGDERRFKTCIRRVLSLDKSSHQFSRLLRPAEHCEILSCLRVVCAVGCNLTVVVH